MGLSSLFAYPNTSHSVVPDDEPFLAHWTHAQWGKFFPLTQTQRYSAGDWVIAPDAVERALYLVAVGKVELLAPAHSSGPSRLALLSAGAVMGIQGFLDGLPQPVAARALTEAEAVRMSFDSFEVFSVREPGLALQLLLALGRALSVRTRRMSM